MRLSACHAGAESRRDRSQALRATPIVIELVTSHAAASRDAPPDASRRATRTTRS
jgi:hypothetical protein